MFLLSIATAHAQIQQAWVARYNNGITNGTNAAIKMAIDSVGNIIVTGYSQDINGNLDYATLKYAPNGNQLWAARYDSGSPAAMALDASNGVVVTGNSVTVKYDSDGNQLWTAPYAGTTLAVDSNADTYVGGFSENFGVAKIGPQGSNIWMTTYIGAYGPTKSQAVLVDHSNNVDVAGLDSDYGFIEHGIEYGPYVQLTTIQYDSNGNEIWKASTAPLKTLTTFHLGGAAVDAANNIYLVTDWPETGGFATYELSFSGNATLIAFLDGDGYSQSSGLVLDTQNDVLLTGKIGDNYPVFYYGTFKLQSNGAEIWENSYPEPAVGVSVATGIATDSANNCYVTGYSPGPNGNNDMVTIAYGPNGNQLWLQRYSGPGIGNAAGNAIAVDKSGNVYVAGYDTTAAGGTEMVLIKYSPLLLQMQTNGAFLLQAQGSPGENFTIQASPDLIRWQTLGTAAADTNGLMQFTDTNAPNYPARFYNTIPQ